MGEGVADRERRAGVPEGEGREPEQLGHLFPQLLDATTTKKLEGFQLLQIEMLHSQS